MAGEHSTTEPSMLQEHGTLQLLLTGARKLYDSKFVQISSLHNSQSSMFAIIIVDIVCFYIRDHLILSIIHTLHDFKHSKLKTEVLSTKTCYARVNVK